MMGLVTLTCVLAIYVGSASSIRCYVGNNDDLRISDCGGSSDKCVKSSVNATVARICYNQINWSDFPTINPKVGCQIIKSFGAETEICICTGDKCNTDIPEANQAVATTTELSSATTTTKSIDSTEAVSDSVTTDISDGVTSDSTTSINTGDSIVTDVVTDNTSYEATEDDIEETTVNPTLATAVLHGQGSESVTHQLTTKDDASTTATAKSENGVKCFVNDGTTKKLKNCGPSSKQCVFTKVQGIVGRLCYDQGVMSKFPMFDARLGCQEIHDFGVHAKICICIGDGCNEGDFNSGKLPATTKESGVDATTTRDITVEINENFNESEPWYTTAPSEITETTDDLLDTTPYEETTTARLFTDIIGAAGAQGAMGTEEASKNTTDYVSTKAITEEGTTEFVRIGSMPNNSVTDITSATGKFVRMGNATAGKPGAIELSSVITTTSSTRPLFASSILVLLVAFFPSFLFL